MKRVFVRLVAVFFVLLIFGILGAASAKANPASLGLGASFRPWNSGGVTQPLQNVQIDIATVPIPGKVPIQGSPYFGNHLVGVDCPGIFCRPSANNYSVDMRNGFAGNYINLLGAPGSQYRGIQFNEFAWCGVGYYGPGNLAAGEFKMQVTINPLPGVQLSPYGGQWRAYWQWVGGDITFASNFENGNSVQVPANNGNLSQVFFVFEENPPPPPPTFEVKFERRSTVEPFNDGYLHYDLQLFQEGTTPPTYDGAGRDPARYSYGGTEGRTGDFSFRPRSDLRNYIQANEDSKIGTPRWFYTAHPGWEIYGYTWCVEGTANAADWLNANPATDPRFSGRSGGSADGKCGYSYRAPYNKDNNFRAQINPNVAPRDGSVKIVYWFQPNAITLKGDKQGPGTFVNQNSETTRLGVGTIDVAGQNVSGNGQAGPWNRAVSYNPTTGNYGVRATAPDGWQVRGYAYCISATTLNNCASNDGVVAPNSQTQGQIILEGNGQASHTVNVDYTSSGIARINGVDVPIGGQLWITFFFKPAPVDVQVRGVIDQQAGGVNSAINPCDANDYKRELCLQSQIRAIRMNTQGVGNNAQLGVNDIGDPAGGYGNCNSTDSVPTKPGYNYTNFGNYYCARGESQAGATPYIRYGQTLIAENGGSRVDGNGNPAENNLAIFRNLYPGKYSFEAANTPNTATTSGALRAAGETNPELNYTVAQSTCAINVQNCAPTMARINDTGGCLLNHRRQAQYADSAWPFLTYIKPNAQWWELVVNDRAGQNYCTVMWAATGGNNRGTPDSWTPSVNINVPTPTVCSGLWYVSPTWNGGLGSYGNCGYPKNSGNAASLTRVYTYTAAVLPGSTSGSGKVLREQTFYYTPKMKLVDPSVVCDVYTARIAFMPDPSRPVANYFRLDNRNLAVSDSDTSDQIVTTTTSGPDAYRVTAQISKYNNGQLVKDGRTRNFQHFARFSVTDPALVNGYPSQAADYSVGGYRYTPTRVFSGNHVCVNDAVCDNEGFNNQLNAISVMDADDPQANRLFVRMTNTGLSYWMRNVNENGPSTRSTGHQLVVTGGTIVSVNGSQGWELGTGELLMPDGSHVYPVNIRPDIDGIDGGDDAEVIFEISPEPPADGGAKYVLGFRMAQDGVPFGTACEGDLDIKVSYKPWLRVQNGNVTALGEILTQSELSRGVYKSETNFTTPYRGSVQMNISGTPPRNDVKPAFNLHAQFVVASEFGGANFCSTNYYMLGIAGDPFLPNAPRNNRDCDFGDVKLNIEQASDSNGDGRKELENDFIINEVQRNFSGAGSDDAYGQCDDTGLDPEVNGGPFELSPPQNYYRTWAPGSTVTAQNLEWTNVDSPDGGDGYFGRYPGNPANPILKLVNSDAPTGRPCPTIYQLQTSDSAEYPEADRPLGGFTVGAGRSTILSDATVYITENIITTTQAPSASYSYKRNGIPDTAGLNELPNLGIIAEGDIVIASNVTQVDASLYATGRIITCDKYLDTPGFIEGSADKRDNEGTTGSKWIRRGGSIGLDSNPLENEKDNPGSLVAEPPNADNVSAKGCANRLRLTGSITAGEGFTLGRNYVDFAGMIQRWSDAQAGAFTQPQAENGKFCNLSTIPGIQRLCNVLGARRDFDSPGNAAQGYLLEYKAGWPQGYYTGGPAEDIIGNGLASFLPPPGFENVNGIVQAPKYYDNTAKPRF